MERAKTKLRALLDFWNEKRREREMPSRADLAVQALRPWLGNLAPEQALALRDGPPGRPAKALIFLVLQFNTQNPAIYFVLMHKLLTIWA